MAEIYFMKIKNASVNGRALIKKIAAEKLNTSEESLVFSENINGKPYFTNFPDFHFNISHSEDGIAIAVDKKEIGIDIEKIRNVNLRVADRFFTDEEKKYVNKDAEFSQKRFFEIWTKKEAYIKKHGLKLADLRSAKSENIYTISHENFIISVCGEFDSAPVLIKV